MTRCYLVAAVVALGACGGSDTVGKADVVRWLRASGGGDDPEQVIEVADHCRGVAGYG